MLMNAEAIDAGGASLTATLFALLTRMGGRWEGCAGDLLALLPNAAPDATRLAKGWMELPTIWRRRAS